MKPWISPVKDDLLGISWKVQHVNPYFRLMFNHKKGRYEVHDTHPKVHPDHTLLLVVMEEDGGPRVPDSRVITSLTELVAPADAQDAMDKIAAKREREYDKRADEIGYGMAFALRYIGKDIVPNATWSARSLKAEAKRVRP